MSKPTLLSATESFRGGRHVVKVELEVEIVDAERLLDSCEDGDHDRHDHLRELSLAAQKARAESAALDK